MVDKINMLWQIYQLKITLDFAIYIENRLLENRNVLAIYNIVYIFEQVVLCLGYIIFGLYKKIERLGAAKTGDKRATDPSK